MNAKEKSPKSISIKIEIRLNSSMLDFEEELQKRLNEAGTIAVKEQLEYMDTDGSAIQVGGTKLTTKGKVSKEYHTGHGTVSVERHVYQSNQGGATYCPMEGNARIIESSTPRLAKIISTKYGTMSGAVQVQKDIQITSGYHISKGYIQNISHAVATIALQKEDKWKYSLPEMERPVKSISIGLDGTTSFITGEGWRETMVGTIAFYDKDGERMHTIYKANAPEYGKETFLANMQKAVNEVKEHYPKATYLGIADGAKSNWEFLEKQTDVQTLDFFHVTEYLGHVKEIIFKKDKENGKEWMEDRCHKLKHNSNYASSILKELIEFNRQKLNSENKKVLQSTITYFENNKSKMNYSHNVENNFPIGSGVTEAACKVIVKQRMCSSGMKWKIEGAQAVLKLRTLYYSNTQLEQFWNKLNQYGIN